MTYDKTINAITKSAKDWKVWLRVVILVIVFFAGSILLAKTKTKTDVTYEAERTRLINFVTEMRNDFAEPTSYVPASMVSFASYTQDTVPQTKVQKWQLKIDSLLKKHKQDSINKLKQKS